MSRRGNRYDNAPQKPLFGKFETARALPKPSATSAAITKKKPARTAGNTRPTPNPIPTIALA